MKNNYFETIARLFREIEIRLKNGKAISYDAALSQIVTLILKQSRQGKKLFFAGNGGSASIASHMAIDFLKNASIPALAFNDSSLLTCISNDLGYEYVFQKPLEILASRGDIAIFISSSGRSKNILNGCKAARKKGCFIITLSGFKKNNPLRKLGDINFYFPTESYGYVEIAHLAIVHCILDTIIKKKR